MAAAHIDKMNRIIDRNGNHIGYCVTHAMEPDEIAAWTRILKSWQLQSDTEGAKPLDAFVPWESN